MLNWYNGRSVITLCLNARDTLIGASRYSFLLRIILTVFKQYIILHNI